MNRFAGALRGLRETGRRHYYLWLLLLLFVSFRVLALLLFRPGGFIVDSSDYWYYYLLGQLSTKGFHPNLNLVTAYPPLFPALVVAVYEWTSRVPAWHDPRLIFHTVLGLIMLVFETGNFLLIAHLARQLLPRPARTDPAAGSESWAALRAPIFYALLFPPVFIWMGWFESLPLFFLLLGLDLLLTGRRKEWGWAGSAVAVAIGFLIKYTPVLLLPLAAQWLAGKRREWRGWSIPWEWRRTLLYGVIFAAVTAVTGYLLVQNNPQMALISLRMVNNRPPWESVWALLEGYWGYGLITIDGRDLAAASGQLWQDRLPWPLITAAFVALYAFLYTRRYDWSRPQTLVSLAGVSTIWLLLLSRGWSPQFLVWVLAFVVLLTPNAFGVVVAVALSLINVAESHLYFNMLPNERWILLAAVLLRTQLLVALVMVFLHTIWPSERPASALRSMGRALGWTSVALFVAASIGGAPRVAQAYWEKTTAEHPCIAGIRYLQEQAEWPVDTIAMTQAELQMQLYPWLRGEYRFVVLDDYTPDKDVQGLVERRLLELGQQTGEFWWVWTDGWMQHLPPEPEAADRYFGRPDVQRIETRTFGLCHMARVVQVPQQPVFTAGTAGGPVQLLRAETGDARAGASLPVVLHWSAATPVSESYTVFTHVVDASGKIVAQQDNLPVGGLAPTTSWQPGKVVWDAYKLQLPGDLAPGEYRLLIGLYTAAGRVPLSLAGGQTGDRLSLPIQISAP